MQVPTQIQRLVDERLAKESPKIFAEVLIQHLRETKYSYKPDYHRGKSNIELINGYCTCDYCINLRKYVKAKLALHRLNKYFYSDHYPFSSKEINTISGEIGKLKQEMSKYKRLKDQVKEELNI